MSSPSSPSSSSDSIKERIPNRYTLVVLAAKRAKQLKEGAPMLIQTESTNCLTIALEEIAAGKINYIEAIEPEDDEVKGNSAPLMVPPAPAPPTAMQMLNESFDEAERVSRSEDEGEASESNNEDADDNSEDLDEQAEADDDSDSPTSVSEED